MLAPLRETLHVKHSAPIIPASFMAGRAWFVAFVSGAGMYHANDRDGRDYFPIERAINELSFETYVPVEIKKEFRRGKRVSRVSPVFGPYVFVRFDPDADDWGDILNTDGVHGFLGAMDVPRRIPDGLISALRRAEEAGAFGGEQLKPGDEVMVTEGPFAHLIGKIKSASKGKRAKVAISELLGALDIETCFLERIR